MDNLPSILKRHVKSLLEQLQSKRNVAKIRQTAPRVTQQDIVAGLRKTGIVAGDVVFVHSSLKSFGYVEGGPRAVLEALYEAVTPAGTLIVPTYYMPGGTIYATCQQVDYIFDPRRHGSNLGALPAAFLQFPGVERSIHPTHSVSAVGRYARYVTEAHHLAPSIFGAGSPWDRCVELGGKIMGLGVSMGPITFYHFLEDRVLDAFPLPVRMQETYRLKCRDWDGNVLEVPVTPLNPVYLPRRIDHPGRADLRDYFWREFKKAGLLTTGQVGEATAWFILASQFYEHLYTLMLQGITIYATAEDLRCRPV